MDERNKETFDEIFVSSEETKAVRKLISRTRHKAEIPLRILGYLTSCFVFLCAGLLGIGFKAEPELYESAMAELGEDEAWIVEFLGGAGVFSVVLLIVGIIVLILFSMYKTYADQMCYSIKVTEKNFPEIYYKSVEFSRKLGLKKVPDVYIQESNGVLNAFATMVPHRKYVHLNAEMVDVAYMEHKDLDVISFAMAHEFGHIYCNHVTLWHNVFFFFIRLIPIFGSLINRAMEYSADRCAQALTDNRGCEDCMMLLCAGRHLYKYADINDYLEQVNGKYSLLERLSRFIVNLLASHPISPFRIKAALDPDRRSGRLI